MILTSKICRIEHNGQPIWAKPKKDCVYLESDDLFVPLAEVKWLPPLELSSRVFCVGRNYADHANEVGDAIPKQPSIFLRTHASLVGHGSELQIPAASSKYDFEGELAVVIGRAGRSILDEDALEHVSGYTLFMDGSIRDYQGHSLFAGKNFDATGAVGPTIVPACSIPDPQDLNFQTRLNGEIVQQFNTRHMIFSIRYLIAYLSSITELQEGDIISTGTPDGVGVARSPQLWMKPGDVIEVEAENIGLLRNSVIRKRFQLLKNLDGH